MKLGPQALLPSGPQEPGQDQDGKGDEQNSLADCLVQSMEGFQAEPPADSLSDATAQKPHPLSGSLKQRLKLLQHAQPDNAAYQPDVGINAGPPNKQV